MPTDIPKTIEELIALITDVLRQDANLRDELNIGNKFRFIRDRLTSLLSRLEEAQAQERLCDEKRCYLVQADEAIVYIYLFNAHGLNFSTWTNMVKPSVFYEYSVNRPIYLSKTHVENYIRSKKTKTQHAYITVAVKRADIFSDIEHLKDALEQPLVKVRENSLDISRVITFTHNEIDYVLDKDGNLVKREETE